MKVKTLAIAGTLVVLLLLATFSISSLGAFGVKRLFSLSADPELQLKQEYRTYFADQSSGAFADLFETPSQQGQPNSPAVNEDSIVLEASTGNAPRIATTQVFDGEEVAVLLSVGGDAYEGSYSVSGLPQGLKCSYSGTPGSTSYTINCPSQLVIFRPRTFDKGYDVVLDGVVVSTFEAPDGFKLDISTQLRGGRRSIAATVDFIGYRSRFCDVRDDEVWIQESFSSPVRIGDLSFPPKQFCHEARPFTLRKLGEGETAIGKREGIIPFNRGEVIPGRELVNEIIVINYATSIAECGFFGCKTCGLGEANVKQADGSFKCQSYLREAEPRVVRETELVIAPANSFQLIATAEDQTFSIGELVFNADQRFTCQVEEGVQRPPLPEPACYTTRLAYATAAVEVQHGMSHAIDGNLRFTYYAGGTWSQDDGEVDNRLTGTYLFTAEKTVSLKIQAVKDGVLVLEATNHLPSNDVLLIKKLRAERVELNLEERQTIRLAHGANIIEVPFNTENLGINELSLQSFYPIEEVSLRGDSLAFGFEVKEEDGDRVIETAAPQDKSLWQRLVSWLLALLGV